MQKAKLTLAAAALITFLPMLQGCIPAIIGGAAVGVMSAYDRRSTGTQADTLIASSKPCAVRPTSRHGCFAQSVAPVHTCKPA